MLFKKLWRTMGLYKAQFISMILMIALGIGVFVGFNIEWYSIEKNTDAFFKDSGFADFRIVSESQEGFSLSDLEKIKEISGVTAATRFVSVNVNIEDGAKDKKGLALTVSENGSVSGFMLTSGKEYDLTDENGIWLSDKFAEENGIKLNDKLKISYSAAVFETEVRGLIKTGEYLVCVRDETQLMPDYKTFGYAYVSPATYSAVYDSILKSGIETELMKNDDVSDEEKAAKKANGVYKKQAEEYFAASYGEKSGKEIYPQINVFSSLDKAALRSATEAALGKTTLVLGADENSSYSAAKGEADEGRTMGSIIPVIFLLIAVLTMVTTMHRLTAKEKTQIGTLKALGYKDRRITLHYTSYAFMIGIIGSAIGTALGYVVALMIFGESGTMGTYFDMPYWKLYMPAFGWAVIFGVIAALTLIGFLSVRKMLKGTAADALRPYTPKKMKKLALERTGLWKKLSFGAKWNLRDAMRHKARTGMSLIGVLGCVIILVGSLGMRDTMQAFLKTYYDDSMLYESRIYFADAASSDKRESVADKYEADVSASVAVELEGKAVSLDIYDTERGKVRFPAKSGGYISPMNADGAFICSRIADEYGLKKGDSFTVSPYGTDKKLTFTVADIMRSVSENIVVSPQTAKTAGLEYGTDYNFDSAYTSVKSDGIQADSVIKSVKSKTDIIKSFDTFTDIMNMMIIILVVAGVALGVVVLYNLGVMSYTERYREMATLKVVGFKNKRIGRLLVGQNIWVTALGLILGIPLGIGLLAFLIAKLATEYEMAIAISPWTIIISVALTFGMSLLVGLMVSKKNKNIDMVEALKGAE